MTRHACTIFCTLAAAIVVGLVFLILDQSPVISFGDPAKSYLRTVDDHSSERPKTPPEFAAGDLVQMCFDDIRWYRIVQSVGKMFVYDANNTRHDFDDKLEPIALHKISLPETIGQLKPKCRVSKIPTGIPPGPSILTGVITSTDTFLGVTRTVTVAYPRMAFVMKAAP